MNRAALDIGHQSSIAAVFQEFLEFRYQVPIFTAITLFLHGQVREHLLGPPCSLTRFNRDIVPQLGELPDRPGIGYSGRPFLEFSSVTLMLFAKSQPGRIG